MGLSYHEGDTNGHVALWITPSVLFRVDDSVERCIELNKQSLRARRGMMSEGQSDVARRLGVAESHGSIESAATCERGDWGRRWRANFGRPKFAPVLRKPSLSSVRHLNQQAITLGQRWVMRFFANIRSALRRSILRRSRFISNDQP
jgi:hypothetical protein